MDGKQARLVQPLGCMCSKCPCDGDCVGFIESHGYVLVIGTLVCWDTVRIQLCCKRKGYFLSGIGHICTFLHAQPQPLSHDVKNEPLARGLTVAWIIFSSSQQTH
eukprot:1156858-Pelagomonas_calceolata.AAC.2